MINHALIRTGFDYEILLGADYFLGIIQAAYDYGEIPAEIPQEDGSVIAVARPHAADILADDDTADLMIFAMVTFVLPVEVGLIFRVGFDADSAQLEFVDLDSVTRELIIAFKGEDGLNLILAGLRTQLNRNFPLSLGTGIVQLDFKKLPEDGDRQAAFGVFANADLKIAPQSGPPEEVFIERGNLDLATSFLPDDQAFAIGLSFQTFQRMANHAWHQTGEERDGELKHPIYDPSDLQKWQEDLDDDPNARKPDPVGTFTSFSITPLNGFIRMTVKSRIFIDVWPDADVTATFNLTPGLDDGSLTMNTELVDYDVDTGLLGDLLAFLSFGLLGVIVLEIVEAIAEGATDDQVAREGRERAAQAFSGLPASFDLFEQRNDPFYKTHIRMRHFYEEARIDALGMSLSGIPAIDEVPEPVPVELIDKRRSDAFPAFQNLMSLFYRIPDFEDGERVELLMSDVLARLPNDQLLRVEMRPTASHRERTIVRDLQFSTGVDFSVDELIFLFRSGVLTIPGYELIEPRRPGVYGRIARPYFRDIADSERDDNLDELPPFEPEG